MGKLINKTQGFTIISSNILRDENLSIRDRGLLCTLLSLPDNWEFSIIGLTKILPDGKDTIRASLQRLEKLGYLKRVQAKDSAGKFTGYDYQLSDTPSHNIATPETSTPENSVNETSISEVSISKKISTKKSSKKAPSKGHLPTASSSEKPSSENPTTGKPTSETPPQLNIKESNIKKLNINHSFYADLLKEQICYEMIEGNDIAKDIFKIMVDVYTSANPEYVVQGRRVPVDELRAKIDKLDYNDILRIADAIKSNDKKIKNIKAYVVACLYNEEYISNIFWTNDFNSSQAKRE